MSTKINDGGDTPEVHGHTAQSKLNHKFLYQAHFCTEIATTN